MKPSMRSRPRFIPCLLTALLFMVCTADHPTFAQSNARPAVILTLPPKWVSDSPAHPYRHDFELHASYALCAGAKSFQCRFIPLNSKSMRQLSTDARKAKGDILLIGDRAEALNNGEPARMFIDAWTHALAAGQLQTYQSRYAK
jgi:hypothetical protein